jgi:hypothetical protein
MEPSTMMIWEQQHESATKHKLQPKTGMAAGMETKIGKRTHNTVR